MKKLLTIMILLLLAGITGCKSQPTNLGRVDQEIDAFIEIYLDDYINDTKQDLYVTRAIALLEANGYDVSLEDYVSKTTLTTKYDALTYDSIPVMFQAISIMDLYDQIPDAVTTALGEIETVETWNQVMAYWCLKKTGANPTLKDSLLQQFLVVRMEDYRDADFAGMALMATADEEVNRTEWLDLIALYTTSDGVASSWGGANACSTAMSVLGLVAIDEDPTTYEDVDLIAALLTYVTDGAARYDLTADLDLQFSTPQVFAALVAYKIFAEKEISVNLLG